MLNNISRRGKKTKGGNSTTKNKTNTKFSELRMPFVCYDTVFKALFIDEVNILVGELARLNSKYSGRTRALESTRSMEPTLPLIDMALSLRTMTIGSPLTPAFSRPS